MKNTLIYSQIAIASMLALSACGPMSQDPLKEYPLTANSRPVTNPDDLRRVDPPTKEVIVVKEVPVDRPVYYAKEPDQNYAAAQLLQINNLGPVSFTAGIESSVNFEVRMLQGQIDFNASLADLDGAKFEQVSAEANKKVYKLTYTPAVDSLVGTSREKTGNLKLQLQIKSIKDANADKQKRLEQAFGAVSMAKPFEYTIRRDLRVPKIEVQNFPATINEGEKKSFSLKVSAPGTYNGFQPEVWVGYDYKGLTGGLYENNGSPFVRPSSAKARVEKVGNGEWLFHYDVDSSLFAVPAQLNNQLQPVAGADSVLLRVSFKVVSPAGSTSDEKIVQYKIVYKKVTAAPTAETK
ncbi:MAG: hypothetical protein KF767_17040 [Bdellovibrionaceae bacterium]|nr:hypothetical protein [Pseudobdellovibrionaceae bacterium]